MKKRISLKELYEGGELPQEQFQSKYSGMDKKAFQESVRKYSQYGQSIYGSKQLQAAVNEIKQIIETAEQMTLQETDEWFDNVTVSRHMKQLKESYKVFEKTAGEMGKLQQRLEACYEEIGKNLGNYWDVE